MSGRAFSELSSVETRGQRLQDRRQVTSLGLASKWPTAFHHKMPRKVKECILNGVFFFYSKVKLLKANSSIRPRGEQCVVHSREAGFERRGHRGAPVRSLFCPLVASCAHCNTKQTQTQCSGVNSPHSFITHTDSLYRTDTSTLMVYV